MSYINNSKNKPYFSQRNNKERPHATCNVTSIINALGASGYPVESLCKKDVQPEGSNLVVSGVFKDGEKIIHHIVAIVGYCDEGFIVDDPWGDYRDKYATIKGDDIVMPFKDFESLIKPTGCAYKMGHVVKRNLNFVEKTDKDFKNKKSIKDEVTENESEKC